MQEDLPSPCSQGQGNQRPDSISAGDPAQQSMNRPARQCDVKPAPYAAAADERQHRPHWLNVSACHEIASDKPGEAGGHPAAWAWKTGILQKRTGSQTQLRVRCKPVRAGLQSCRDDQKRQATHSDQQSHNAGIGRSTLSIVTPRINKGYRLLHKRLVYRTGKRR